MGPDDGHHPVAFEELASEFATEEVGASAHFVGLDEGVAGSGFAVDGVRPHQVAEKSVLGNLPEAVDFLDVVQLNRAR
jgi:hypothetical protein